MLSKKMMRIVAILGLIGGSFLVANLSINQRFLPQAGAVDEECDNCSYRGCIGEGCECPGNGAGCAEANCGGGAACYSSYGCGNETVCELHPSNRDCSEGGCACRRCGHDEKGSGTKGENCRGANCPKPNHCDTSLPGGPCGCTGAACIRCSPECLAASDDPCTTSGGANQPCPTHGCQLLGCNNKCGGLYCAKTPPAEIKENLMCRPDPRAPDHCGGPP